MDLDKTFTPEAAMDIDSMANVPTLNTLPLGSIRNRAATTALLSSSPADVVQNYQLMVKEGQEGQSAVLGDYNKRILESTETADMQGLMSVLSDPAVPYEKKKQFVQGVRTDKLLRDSSTTLLSNSLVAPVEGENYDQENARISTADAIREIHDARVQIQGLVNAHGASLEGANVETVGDMAALWVMPFGNSISTGKVAKGVAKAEGRPLTFWETVKGFLAPGSSTMDMRKRLESMPPEKRVAYAQSLIQGIKANSGILFGEDNQFAQFDKAVAIFEEGGYSDTQAFLDNISPLLDVVGLGQVMRGTSRGLKAEKAAKAAQEGEQVIKAERELVDDRPRAGMDKQIPFFENKLEYVNDQVKRIEQNAVVRKENPASPAKVIQQGNPEQARNIHAAVHTSEGDEIAEATYGASKVDAIVSDTVPQVVTESGAVTAKVSDIERNLRRELQINDELVDLIENTGATYYTKAEKAQARSNIVNDFGAVEGLTINDAMSSFTTEGGRIKIGAVYGTADGAWNRAEDAFTQARFALRSRGVLDSEITVLKKQGLDYVPVKMDEVKGVDGNYLIRVETNHNIDPTDISSFEQFDVKRNLFDRIGPTVSQSTGSVSRYLFDAASMLHPTYVGPAVVASDRSAKFEKFMLEMASDFSDKYMGFDKARKAKLDDYIREANYNGIKFDQADLVARGFTGDEIDALAAWRRYWDGQFYLENYDVVKTLNSHGYELFRNQNTELYVKPVPKNQNITRVYDPAQDAVVTISKTEMDNLYASGGTYAKLRRPTDFSGDVAEHMIVRNTATEYTRPFRDMDQVLNYREGYFQIHYNAPKFVDQATKFDTTGKPIEWKTVAVAGDTKEAQFFADRSAATNGMPKEHFRVRGDIKALQRDSDAWWDLNSASGRVAQRHRGKLLEDASGLNHLGDGSYIANPVDSAVRAAKSISGRTVSRPMLEAAKARFINQYGDALPSNGIGGRAWPRSVSQITMKGADTSKFVADARTTYEYINYLENGYMNTLDDVFKWGLNAIADMAGQAGLSKTERAITAVGGSAPTSLAKNSVFMAYIGTNPLRQWIIQPHQVIRTLAYNPQGWLSGATPKLAATYSHHISGLKTTYTKEERAFVDFIDQSGMFDSVDKQNLVRGTLMAAADSSNVALRNAKKYTTTLTRQIGFDIGEMANLLGHASAVYEAKTRQGINLANKAERDLAYSEIRAISYDMNFAGDMPYNQTTPSMVLQFMQVPHKALLQMTNRRIPVPARLRMAGFDLLMWGGPVLLVGSMIGKDILPDNPALRETFAWGLESYLLNNSMSIIAKEDVNIDFSSLAPYDMTGWRDFFIAMYEGGASKMITNSPAGQMFLKSGGRAQNAVGAMGRYFGIVEDMDEDGQTFIEVMNEVAKMSSGYSNAVKAKLLLDAQKRYDQYGNTIDKSVSHVEAWAQLFGFGTEDTRDLYRMTKELSKDVKKHREEVLQIYEDTKRYYATKLGVDNADPKYITKVTGRILKVFEDDPKALNIIRSKMAEDFRGKDAALLDLFIKKSQIPSLGNLKDQVKQMPVDEAQKEKMMQIIKDMENIRLKKQKE